MLGRGSAITGARSQLLVLAVLGQRRGHSDARFSKGYSDASADKNVTKLLARRATCKHNNSKQMDDNWAHENQENRADEPFGHWLPPFLAASGTFVEHCFEGAERPPGDYRGTGCNRCHLYSGGGRSCEEHTKMKRVRHSKRSACSRASGRAADESVNTWKGANVYDEAHVCVCVRACVDAQEISGIN
jgi:hypothetical protein